MGIDRVITLTDVIKFVSRVDVQERLKLLIIKTVSIYKNRFGNTLDECPKCKSVYDLLNEE